MADFNLLQGLLGQRAPGQVPAVLGGLRLLMLTDRILDSTGDPSGSHAGDYHTFSTNFPLSLNFTHKCRSAPSSELSLSLPQSWLYIFYLADPLD